MLKNNILANRLNAFKKGEPIPEVEKDILSNTSLIDTFNTSSQENIQTTKQQIISEIGYIVFNLSFAVFKSFVYGYSIKTIFNTDWKILSFFAVGLSLHFLITEIQKFFLNTNNNEK